MSKKKAFGGSTMTLKDFHGGSIPSELPLPSAPGVLVRQPDRVGHDRPSGGAWGSMARADPHRPSRPGSAGSRGLDEAAPFLPSTARIGRNFDEDERKPFDSSSAPRRAPVPDPETDPARSLLSPQPKQQLFGRPGTSPGAVARDFSGELGFPAVAPSRPLVGPGAAPNAWGVRKEVAMEPQVQPVSALTGAAAASRFAQASAMEKISSGRWQAKPAAGFGQGADVEVICFAEVDRWNAGLRSNSVACGGVNSEARSIVRGDEAEVGYNGVSIGRVVNGAPRSPEILEVKVRNGSGEFQYGGSPPGSSEGWYGGMPVYDREEGFGGYSQVSGPEGRFGGQQVLHLEGRFGEMHMSQRGYPDGLKVRQVEEHFGGVQTTRQVEHQEIADLPERPKLRLLPRSKLLETSLILASVGKQEQQPQSVDLRASECVNDVHINSRSMKSGTAAGDGVNQVVERPRLNLKPRSQPVGQSDESIERERKSVFGGARPRELVLKERGIEANSNNSPPYLPDSRTKRELPKVVDEKQDPAAFVNHSEKSQSYTVEHWAGKDLEQKDSRAGPTKSDAQWGTRGHDNRRNTREYEKPTERRPEPESWRRPVEEPKPEIPAPRHGKATSALELAQAFSRSASATDVRPDTRLAGNQKAVSGRSQVPFSRLTDNREIYSGPSPRKINGY